MLVAGAVSTLSGVTIKAPSEAHTYTIALDPEYAPYTLRNEEGEAAGIFVELWKLWARKTHSRVQFRFYPWEESIEAVRRGEADFHAGTVPDREWMVASKAFWTIESSLFTLRDSPYRNAESLKSARIGMLNSFYGGLLHKRLGSSLTFKQYRDYRHIVRALEKGEIDALIGNTKAVWYYLIKTGRVSEFRTIKDPSLIFYNPVQTVTNPEHAALISLINQGLSSITTKEKEEIFNHWLIPQLVNPLVPNTSRTAQGSDAGHDPFKITMVALVTFALGILAFLLIRDRKERRRIERLAHTDDLTGLRNKREFNNYFYETPSKGENIGLLIIDVDLFKNYNDTYGHLKGDEVLRRIGEILRSLESETIKAFRIGGEEFALLFYGRNRDQLCRIAENIRQEVEALQIPHEQSPYGVVTVSIGGLFQPNGQQRKELFICTDSALYEAKASGRNRIKCHDRLQNSKDTNPLIGDTLASEKSRHRSSHLHP